MKAKYSLIPLEERTGLTCDNCSTNKSVKYLHNNGNHYCNKCILAMV